MDLGFDNAIVPKIMKMVKTGGFASRLRLIQR